MKQSLKKWKSLKSVKTTLNKWKLLPEQAKITLKRKWFFQKEWKSHQMSELILTLSWVWWGRCKKNYLPKEEGREGGEKKGAQRARRARGSNPGPAAC